MLHHILSFFAHIPKICVDLKKTDYSNSFLFCFLLNLLKMYYSLSDQYFLCLFSTFITLIVKDILDMIKTAPSIYFASYHEFITNNAHIFLSSFYFYRSIQFKSRRYGKNMCVSVCMLVLYKMSFCILWILPNVVCFYVVFVYVYNKRSGVCGVPIFNYTCTGAV